MQNYRTNEVLVLSDEVSLPKASIVKELKPANVVIVTRDYLMLNKDIVAPFIKVKEQADWKIVNLMAKLQVAFKEKAEEGKRLGFTIKEATGKNAKSTADWEARRVTVQADRTVDFLTIKKVLFTLTEAGASEINFAVLKEEVK